MYVSRPISLMIALSPPPSFPQKGGIAVDHLPVLLVQVEDRQGAAVGHRAAMRVRGAQHQAVTSQAGLLQVTCFMVGATGLKPVTSCV